MTFENIYFLEDESLYFYDEEEKKYKLTKKGQEDKKAVKSYNETYKELNRKYE